MNIVIKNTTNEGIFETPLKDVSSLVFNENSVVTKHNNKFADTITPLRANNGIDNWDWQKVVIEIERVGIGFQ